MRRVVGVTCALFLVACMGSLDWGEPMGAASGGDPSPMGQNHFALEGDGESLWLDGTPLDPTYAATYPNPESVSSMRVTVDADGSVRPTCESGSGSVPCSATPFVTNAQRTELGTQVRVWDVYGQLIAILAFEEEPEVQQLTDPEPEEPPEEDVQDPEIEPEPEEVPAEPSEEPADETGGGTPEPDRCDIATLSGEMCAFIETQLGGYSMDCSELDGVFGEEPDRWGLVLSGVMDLDAALTPCEDVIYGRGREFQNDVLDRCPGAGVELNNLMHDARIILMYAGQCRGSPLVLDLDGDGIRTTGLDEGVSFDLFGVGAPVESAWLDGDDDAFLAFDRDGDGLIQGGRELFGNGTAGGPFGDGFEALRQLDTNDDGWVDRFDADFVDLLLWIDSDGDGSSTAEELSVLEESSVVAIDLRPLEVPAFLRADDGENGMPLSSRFLRADGSSGEVVDVFFRFRLPRVAQASRRSTM